MRLVKSLVSIFVLAVLIGGVIKFKNSVYYDSFLQNISGIKEFLGYKLKIIKNNISEDFTPSRKAPLTFIKKEEELKQFLPQVFGDFDSQDWQEFWGLIYGHKRVGEGLIKQKVYRSKEEIEDYLVYNYSNPFSYFQKQHWDYFWSIVLGND